MKSPAPLLRSLLNDIRRFHTDVECLDRDFLTIQHRVEHEGFGFITRTLPSLMESIIDGLQTGTFCCPRAFKRARGKSIPAFLQGMISKVFDASSGHLLPEADASMIGSLNQLLNIGSKLVTSSDKEETLYKSAITKFLETDDAVTESYSERVSYRLKWISHCILQGLNDNLFDPSRLQGHLGIDEPVCKNGPGAVSDLSTPNQKWVGVWEGFSEKSTLLSHFGYEPRKIKSLSSEDFIIQSDMFGRDSHAFGGNARVVAVPKNASSMRTITVEPCLNQFIQQGLNSVLRSEIRRDPILSNCLSLSDQGENNRLAQIGSRDQSYATIDLSSASDLLSQKLVEDVFHSRKEFLRSLFLCRTSTLEVSGVTRTLRKYAGMGNATTFPVQSIVFAILCIESILDSEGCELSYRNVERASERIRVYGDDIIVPTEYASSVVHRLELVGLKVNGQKSFLKGNFRESCGTDFFKGEHVRPGFLRHHFGTGTASEALGNLVCLANLLGDRFYHETATMIRRYVEKHLGYKLPYVRSVRNLAKGGDHLAPIDQPVALGWTSRRGFYSTERYCKNLQRPICLAPVIIPTRRNDALDDYPALMKFYHVSIQGRDNRHLAETVRRFSTKLKRRWVAC